MTKRRQPCKGKGIQAKRKVRENVPRQEGARDFQECSVYNGYSRVGSQTHRLGEHLGLLTAALERREMSLPSTEHVIQTQRPQAR